MEEVVILRVLFGMGIGLFLLALKKPPRKNWLSIYFITAYFAILLGFLVAENHLIVYPVRCFEEIPSSVLFELLLFPVLCMYYYQTSYHSGIKGVIGQAALYSSLLTFVEFLLEKYTDLVQYLEWEWYYTLISVFLFMIIVRLLTQLIGEELNSKRNRGSMNE